MSLAPPARKLGPGFRLDRYELLWPIAEGGMASVWLARLHGKHGFEKLVAVKTILSKYADDPRFESMFRDEARIASAIEHTNVARILDLGEEHDVLYMAMEWVDGDSLSKLQRTLARAGVPFPQGVLLRVMADACAGLHAAHELRGRDGMPLGIVHRDVSPQNILVNVDGVAKIIDFGVAKARDRMSEDTSGGALKGKIQYMAPEQALGRPLDRRADVWAIGAVLYYFFSGRRVYESESELATLQLLTSGQPPPPLPRSVAPPIAEIIRGALRFNPDERWANLDMVRRRLEQAMVDLRCFVRPEDVATFLGSYAQDRALSRRTTVTNALQAADARAALEKEKSSSSVSGLLDVQSRANGSLVTPAVPAGGTDPRMVGRVTGETSSATLGSAALEASISAPRRSMALWFGGIAAVGTLAAGAAGLIYVLRTSAGPSAVVVAAPAPATHRAPDTPHDPATPPPAAAPAPPPATAPPERAAAAPPASGAPAEAEPSGAAAIELPSTSAPSPVTIPVSSLPVAKPATTISPASAAAPAKPASKKSVPRKGSADLRGSDTQTDDGF